MATKRQMETDPDVHEMIRKARKEHPDPLDAQFLFPDWMPAPYREMFRTSLRRLKSSGVTEDDIRAFAASYRSTLTAAAGEKFEKGWHWAPPVPPDNFDDAHRIAHILSCFEIAENDGEQSALAALSGPNAAGLTDLLRGRKSVESGTKGAELRHGNLVTRKERYAAMERAVDEISSRNPGMSWSRVCDLAAKHLTARGMKMVGRTIRDHVPNPHRTRQKPGG